MKIIGVLIAITCFICIIGGIANLLRFTTHLFGKHKTFENRNFYMFLIYFILSIVLFLVIRSNLGLFEIEVITK